MTAQRFGVNWVYPTLFYRGSNYGFRAICRGAELVGRLHPVDISLIRHGRIIYVGRGVDCAPPTGEFSPRIEGSATGGFSLLNPHLVFLRG